MGTYWNDFVSIHKQQILWNWNNVQMLEEFFKWLARQPYVANELEKSALAQKQRHADANAQPTQD